MFLEDVLKHRSVQAADPLLRAGASAVHGRQVRWVHSSEVLDIAPLLRGGELLLSGGQALATASDQRRVDYVRELAGRGVAALAVETGPVLPDIPESMLLTAESQGLPLFELRKVAPFVGIMQEINSILVGQSVELLQRGDEISHAMAAELAHGGGLDEVLAVLAGQTGTRVRLVSPAGLTLGSAGVGSAGGGAGVAVGAADVESSGTADGGGSAGRPGTGGSGISTATVSTTAVSTTAVDVPVRGVLAARLELEVPEGVDPTFVRVAGERSIDILGLALLQRMPPGLKELAGAELMRAVHSGAQPWRLEQLGAAAGFAVDGPVAAVMIRSATSGRLRPALDAVLAASVPHAASYADKLELIALAGLPREGTRAARASLIAALGGLDAPEGSATAVGPLGQGIGEAAWSMAEARRTLDLAPRTGRSARQVRDADAFGAERLAAESIDAAARRDFVRRTLGPILEHDEQRNSQLLHTLTVWLDSGCNTAQAARELHLERQSMYHRLQRIFDLCGGDPRGTGRLVGLHLATRLAPLP